MTGLRVFAGGEPNTAGGAVSTVSGCNCNTASAGANTVPGGSGNVANGTYSFASGRSARAVHDGAFVRGDSTLSPISSTARNQFIVRASDGVTMYSNSAATIGAALLPGSGSWSSVSDRSAKMNFAEVDTRAVLAALASIPLETWSYKTQDTSIRHIGPMAQDFNAAFGVGENDTTISTVDADGVALAAIQGLNQLLQEKDARIAALEASNAVQQRQLADVQARLGALEHGQGSGALAAGVPVEWYAIGALALMNGLLMVVVAAHVRRG